MYVCSQFQVKKTFKVYKSGLTVDIHVSTKKMCDWLNLDQA